VLHETLICFACFMSFCLSRWRALKLFACCSVIQDVTKMDITLQGEVVRIQGDEFWHMTRVLRLGVNDRYYCFSSSVEYTRLPWLLHEYLFSY